VSEYQRALVEWDEMVVTNAPIPTICTCGEGDENGADGWYTRGVRCRYRLTASVGRGCSQNPLVTSYRTPVKAEARQVASRAVRAQGRTNVTLGCFAVRCVMEPSHRTKERERVASRHLASRVTGNGWVRRLRSLSLRIFCMSCAQ
jgi:hypothetical protein